MFLVLETIIIVHIGNFDLQCKGCVSLDWRVWSADGCWTANRWLCVVAGITLISHGCLRSVIRIWARIWPNSRVYIWVSSTVWVRCTKSSPTSPNTRTRWERTQLRPQRTHFFCCVTEFTVFSRSACVVPVCAGEGWTVPSSETESQTGAGDRHDGSSQLIRTGNLCVFLHQDKTTTLNVGGVDFALFLDDLLLSAVDVFTERGQRHSFLFWRDNEDVWDLWWSHVTCHEPTIVTDLRTL